MNDPVYLIRPGLTYVHKLDHRNGNPHKSQWTVDEPNERICFESAHERWRGSDCICWGLHFEDGNAAYLGITKKSDPDRRQLFIGKFIDSTNNATWHGYPADHVANRQDIPPEAVLKSWQKAGMLRSALVRKISKGQRCLL